MLHFDEECSRGIGLGEVKNKKESSSSSTQMTCEYKSVWIIKSIFKPSGWETDTDSPIAVKQSPVPILIMECETHL